MRIPRALICLCGCSGWFALLLFANFRSQVFLASRPFIVRWQRNELIVLLKLHSCTGICMSCFLLSEFCFINCRISGKYLTSEIYLHPQWLRLLSILRWDSVVVDSLCMIALIVCWDFVFGHCIVVWYLLSFLVLQSSR